jgi:hypothetical protein
MQNFFMCFLVVLMLCIPALAIVSQVLQIVNYYRATNRFVPSIQTRERIEHLIATTNDETNSTLYESRQLIETDALALPIALRTAFIAGLRQASPGGRINYTKRILRDFYLPRTAQPVAA